MSWDPACDRGSKLVNELDHCSKPLEASPLSDQMEQINEPISLHERRRRRKDVDAPVNFSQIRWPSKSADVDVVLRNQHNPGSTQGRMAPPETPMSPQEMGHSQTEQHSLFHNYLRAFCHFDPPTNPEENEEALLMTAPIRPGDLILVHSVHANGWADGTVLTTGARGWLPTNYCEAFDPPYMRSLLNAMTQFWDLLGAGEDANLSTFVRQDYIRGLIAGVRYLLEHADCLHRDAPLVQRHSGIRRMRKGLLADLSTLVQIAKRLQETISEPYAGEVIHVLLEDLVGKAFRVLTRAVGFVDMWTQEPVEMMQLRGGQPATHEPTTPPTDNDGLGIDTNIPSREEITCAMDSAKHLPETAAADNAMKATLNDSQAQDDNGPDAKRTSIVFRPPSGLLAHRLSLVKTESTRPGTLASDQLVKAHDMCISHIGSFIGLHLHSRPSSEHVATTDRLVQACKDMLAIADHVFLHDSQKTVAVQQARINLQVKLDELTKSTKDVFKFSDFPDDEVVMLPQQSTRLVHVGTSLIRTVGECVVKTRQLIERIGDFTLENPPLDETLSQGQAESGASPVQEQKSFEPQSTPTAEKRISKKTLPPPPPLRPRAMTSIQITDFAIASPTDTNSPMTPFSTASHNSLPLPKRLPARASQSGLSDADALTSPRSFRPDSTSPGRKTSFGPSIAGSTDTHQSSIRDSAITAVSEISTRATTPDNSKDSKDSPDPGLMNSFASLSSLGSAANTDASSDAEAQLLHKTYANELTLNKDGQVTGGSLPALVEQLTTHDSAPDAQFVAAFFITFRLFTTPRELAQGLIDRFEYVGDSKTVGTPVRLRIYNVFKGWLETYWNPEADRDALGDIRYFALHKLKPHLPSAGERLVELTRKVTSGYHTETITGPLVSGVGKISMSIGSQFENEGAVPEPVISKNQLIALRSSLDTCSVLDFDPLELARQLTILSSKIFCEIRPEELLSLDWNKKTTAKARNIRNMCTLNTDLAHVVGDTILSPEDAKKRALVIKHWSKIAMRCLELNNYESLMAIMCSLNSSVVQRLKRTWEIVSKKTKARLDELRGVVDFSRNQASLRRRLENPVAPCLPFLGVYLTDLTFVDVGNPKLRELPGAASASGEAVSVINFDKHMRMAKIVSHVRKFQVPYRLEPIPEMQAWMQAHLQRMREGQAEMVSKFHRRSLVIEPKQHDMKALKFIEATKSNETSHTEERPKTSASTKTVGGSVKIDGATTENFNSFLKTSLTFKATSGRHGLPTPDTEEPK